MVSSYTYPENELLLTEGRVYDFLVYKRITLQDSEEYFILEDFNHLKHFVPVKPYAEYGLYVGGTVTCKVARINCTGRVFLEPSHPVYIPGMVYQFRVLYVENISDKSDFVSVCISDCFDNLLSLKASTAAFFGREIEWISCRVSAITKGIPELEFVP